MKADVFDDCYILIYYRIPVVVWFFCLVIDARVTLIKTATTATAMRNIDIKIRIFFHLESGHFAH